MHIESPTLQLNETASVSALSAAALALEGKEDPFLILSKTPTSYMQALWTDDGFVLEYQEDSIAKHYVANELLTAEAMRETLIQYLNGIDEWKHAHTFSNKNIAGLSWRIGYSLGFLTGRIRALFHQT